MPKRHVLLLSLAGAAAPAVAQQAVPLSSFESIELVGGGTVHIRHASVQRVLLAQGSTDFTTLRIERNNGEAHARLVIRSCERRCPANYRLRVEIDMPEIDALAIRGGGEIVAAPGFPRQRSLAVAVAGGGALDARALPVSRVVAAVHGGGSLLVQAQRSLVAAVNGGGLIRYWGNAQVTPAVSGGGAIQRAG